MAKLLLILLDGVADRPDPTLNWTTPLEAARTPHLDSLARVGMLRTVQPLGRKLAPESDAAVFSILGYQLEKEYPGRGAIEAVGAGLDFKDGDLALRANFATVASDLTIVDRRAGRDLTDAEAQELASLINQKVKLRGASFTFLPTIGYRGVVAIRAEKPLSANITNTDPAYIRRGRMGIVAGESGGLRLLDCKPTDGQKSSRIAADLVNTFVRQSFEYLRSSEVNVIRRVKEGKKPANALLLRDAGNSLPTIQKLPEKYGISFASIVDMPVEKGISRLTGMAEFEGGSQQDYEKKAERCMELLGRYDVVYVHIKGPDEPGHDGNARAKKRVIEEIDGRLFKKILAQVDLDESFIVLSADHATPCILRAHSDDEVPLLICGPKVSGKFGCRFTERHARLMSKMPMPSYHVLDWIIRDFLQA